MEVLLLHCRRRRYCYYVIRYAPRLLYYYCERLSPKARRVRTNAAVAHTHTHTDAHTHRHTLARAHTVGGGGAHTHARTLPTHARHTYARTHTHTRGRTTTVAAAAFPQRRRSYAPAATAFFAMIIKNIIIRHRLSRRVGETKVCRGELLRCRRPKNGSAGAHTERINI